MKNKNYKHFPSHMISRARRKQKIYYFVCRKWKIVDKSSEVIQSSSTARNNNIDSVQRCDALAREKNLWTQRQSALTWFFSCPVWLKISRNHVPFTFSLRSHVTAVFAFLCNCEWPRNGWKLKSIYDCNSCAKDYCCCGHSMLIDVRQVEATTTFEQLARQQ